jgi:methyl-accepting chemotaxis protein
MDSNATTMVDRNTLGSTISNRLVQSLRSMRSTTERAVLTIGGLLNRIVSVATHDNGEIQQTLSTIVGNAGSTGRDDSSVSSAIEAQTAAVEHFVNEAREFFHQQSLFATDANEACKRINDCAKSVSDLTGKSHILALNMQIESARLGSQGQAFTVIGQEMKRFAIDVRQANDAIKGALATLLVSIPRLHDETARMDAKATQFSQQLEQQIAQVKDRTEALTRFLQSTLDRAEQRNNDVVAASHSMLSELQFQDPMAQEMQRAEHDVTKLSQLIEYGECNDISLADLDPTVGHGADENRCSGSVELF